MNVLFYSSDDGSASSSAALKNVVKRFNHSKDRESQIQVGNIQFIGWDAEGNLIYSCGVHESEPICKLEWIHALEHNLLLLRKFSFVHHSGPYPSKELA